MALRILQVSLAFYPASFYGGPPYVVYRLSKELVRLGHEVIVYTTDAFDSKSRAPKDLYKNFLKEGLEVHYFKNLSNFLAWSQHIFIPLGMIKKIKEKLTYFDIVHLHEYRSIQENLIHFYACKYNKPYVITTHGIDPVPPAENPKLRFKRIYDRFIGNKVLKDASAIFAMHKNDILQLLGMGVDKEKIKLVPNGIDIPQSLPPKGFLRSKFGINDGRIILFVGRIAKIKGVDILIKAFARLTKEVDDAYLVIAGKDYGFAKEAYKLVNSLKIEKRVFFYLSFPENLKYSVFADADVYVLPSRFDVFPISVLEACSLGVPVIVSDKCGIVEWALNKELYVTSIDENKLKEAIYIVLEREKNIYSEKAKSFAQRFSWTNIAKLVEKLYFECLEKRE